ncbi:Acd4 [Desulforapulum autotrophicum HRM2]|uniref:Cyclohex-1-ene-1-carbonyl-CoA dehydrogenase n=1 Tax=Desulforapulum autotrophicum (strain ATCC 43914 / DSM 3382 / VKM B-1955 / HRM2) TaxID=177437 RepID=C0QL99_DESAH|nr:acyl-CoA dehydrogenase [Desulforapulum autotrophicum]ACN14185.1 Acd4 [Desulforapulum autotrophicum HRM2]
MSFKLSDEQLMIQSMVREFSRKVVAATAAERDQTKEFPWKNFKQMGELGLMGMMIPTEYGGEGADAVSYVLALSEIAYSCASTSVVMSVQNSIVCESINRFGTEEQKQTFLVPLAQGEIIGAFALTEPDAGSDPVSQTTTAVRDDNNYVINGTKRFITSGKNSRAVIVTAKTDETARHKGISAFLVAKDTPGLIVGHMEDKMGLRASDTTDLIFENCRVPASALLGNEGDGFKIAMAGLDSGRIGIAAQSLGVAQAALDASVKYAKKRKQFGKAIANHQGIRWQIADMATQIEAARQLVMSAASMKDRKENYTTQASMAKLFASEMVNQVTARAIQIHGGYGFTKDYPVERFYRDARVFTIYEGTSEIQRIVISNSVLK